VIVKIVDAPMVQGGKAPVICDDSGKILPGQFRTVIESEVGTVPLITVTFEIDGKTIRFEDAQ
jgi:hypothetical protein